MQHPGWLWGPWERCPLDSILDCCGAELDQVGGNATLPRSFPTPPVCHLRQLSTFLSWLSYTRKKKKIHNLPLDVSWESRAKQVTRGTEWSVGTAGRRKWKLLDPGKVLHKVHSLPSLYCYTHFTDQEEKAQRSKLA